MNIHFSVTWGKHGLFNEGQRSFTMEWEKGFAIPREGDAINIPSFIEETFTNDELLTHNNEETNVFEWIQITIGWEVEKLHWYMLDGTITVDILVTERG